MNTVLAAAAVTAIISMTSVIVSDGVQAASASDNMPSGRTPTAIVDGQYPASYFPNTELFGAAEMRITALGRRLSLGAIAREQRRDHGRRPQDL